MPKKKAPRNKTIDTSVTDGKALLARCIEIGAPVESLGAVLNKTVHGDMLAVCPLLPKESVDLIVADPPYNRTKAFHGGVFSKKTAAEYEAYTRAWLEAVRPLLKKNGSIYVCCDWETSLIVARVLGEGFTIRNRITWQREKGRGAKRNWKNGMEDIWFATAGDDYTFNIDNVKQRRQVIAPYRADGKPKDWNETGGGRFRDTCPSNFWDDITVPFWSMAENTAHPTQKPEKLIAKLILASSDPGGVVFDPFLGAGTTSVVAKKLGRSYLGIEQDAQYCVWAEQRLALADTDKTIQGYTDGVFWERNTLSAQRKK